MRSPIVFPHTLGPRAYRAIHRDVGAGARFRRFVTSDDAESITITILAASCARLRSTFGEFDMVQFSDCCDAARVAVTTISAGLALVVWMAFIHL